MASILDFMDTGEDEPIDYSSPVDLNDDLATLRAYEEENSSFGAGLHPEQLKPQIDEEAAQTRSFAQAAGDTSLSLAQGFVGLGEGTVGLVDLVTPGQLGKFVEDNIVDFDKSSEFYEEKKSDKTRQSQKEFEEADGFWNSIKSIAHDPLLIGQAVAQSLPSMWGGAKIGQFLTGFSKIKNAAVVAGSLGEGLMAAGSSSEGIRGQTEDGTISSKQSLYAGAIGAGTSAMGVIGAKVAKAFGVTDIDVRLAGGNIEEALTRKGITKAAIKGAIAEGVFEELPQSVQETVLQNLALDKEPFEGIDKAAIMGTLSGMAMGGPMAGVDTLKSNVAVAAKKKFDEAFAAKQKTPEENATEARQAAEAAVPEGTDPVEREEAVLEKETENLAAKVGSQDSANRLRQGEAITVESEDAAVDILFNLDPAEIQTNTQINDDGSVTIVPTILTAEKEDVAAGEGLETTGEAQADVNPSATMPEVVEPAVNEIPEPIAIDNPIEEKPVAILTKQGTPYKSQAAALNALRIRKDLNTEEHEVVPHGEGGFAIQPLTKTETETANVEDTEYIPPSVEAVKADPVAKEDFTEYDEILDEDIDEETVKQNQKKYEEQLLKLQEEDEGYLYQLGTTEREEANKELDARLTKLMEENNVVVEEIESLKEEYGVDAVGVSDLLNKLIVVRKNRNLKTVPEEAVHMAIALLGEPKTSNNILQGRIKELMGNIENWSGYDAIYQRYSRLPNYKGNELKLKHEAVTKLITDVLVNEHKKETSLSAKVKDIFNDMVEWVKTTFFGKDKIGIYQKNAAKDIAKAMLEGDLQIDKNTDGKIPLHYEKSLEKNPLASSIVKLLAKTNSHLTGSLQIAKQREDIYRTKNNIHDLDFQTDQESADKIIPAFIKAGAVQTMEINKEEYNTLSFRVPAPGYKLVQNLGEDANPRHPYKLIHKKTGNRIPLHDTTKSIVVDLFIYPEGKQLQEITANQIYDAKQSMKDPDRFIAYRDKDIKDFALRNPADRKTDKSPKHLLFQVEDDNTANRYSVEENINELPENEVFVFGSNEAGRHGKGAAKVAKDKFGATYGQGVGEQGQSYAIPTKDKDLNTLSLNKVKSYISDFLTHAESNPDTIFNVTAIGTGLAGFKAEEIAPLFENAPANVKLPRKWNGVEATQATNKTATKKSASRKGAIPANLEVTVSRVTEDGDTVQIQVNAKEEYAMLAERKDKLSEILKGCFGR